MATGAFKSRLFPLIDMMLLLMGLFLILLAKARFDMTEEQRAREEAEELRMEAQEQIMSPEMEALLERYLDGTRIIVLEADKVYGTIYRLNPDSTRGEQVRGLTDLALQADLDLSSKCLILVRVTGNILGVGRFNEREIRQEYEDLDVERDVVVVFAKPS